MPRLYFWLTSAGVVATVSVAVAVAMGPQDSSAQADPESAKDDIAAQIRAQGYACDKPTSARRDPEASRPDEPVWILECENQSYRVRLVPDQAAKVEPLQ